MHVSKYSLTHAVTCKSELLAIFSGKSYRLRCRVSLHYTLGEGRVKERVEEASSRERTRRQSVSLSASELFVRIVIFCCASSPDIDRIVAQTSLQPRDVPAVDVMLCRFSSDHTEWQVDSQRSTLSFVLHVLCRDHRRCSAA